MIGFLQRVTSAAVFVAGERIATTGPGLLVLVGIQPKDTPAHADRLTDKLLGYRVFADDAGRMNRSLTDTGGGLLLVPQFTLCADTRRGLRPGFEGCAPADQARALFGVLCQQAAARHPVVASGRFGADMQVHLVNDGPVSFWLEV